MQCTVSDTVILSSQAQQGHAEYAPELDCAACCMPHKAAADLFSNSFSSFVP